MTSQPGYEAIAMHILHLHLTGFSSNQIKQSFLEDESPTLKDDTDVSDK